MGDIGRYYVLPGARKASVAPADQGQLVAGTAIRRPKPKLPTPAAFFERQQRMKEADRKAMMRFAARKTVKHNLHVRYDDLRRAREDLAEELSVKLTGTKPAGGAKHFETEQEYMERSQARKTQRDQGLKPGANDFYLKDVDEAIDEENEDKLNRSILESFFEQFAPARVKEVPELLERYKGDEFSLFKSLAEQYKIDVSKGKKPPTDAKITATIEDVPLETETPAELVNRGSFIAKSEKPSGSVATIPEVARGTGSVASVPEIVKATPKSPTPFKSPIMNFKTQNPDVEPIKSMKSSGSTNSGDSKRKTHLSALSRNGSLISNGSMATMEPVTEEMRQFQKALDEEIKGKLYSGEYVVSIVESGGRWWVNRDKPKVHPSQRRRNTLLDELRQGHVPISNETMSPSTAAATADI